MAGQLRFTAPAGSRGRKAVLNGYLYTCQQKGTPTVRSRWQCTNRGTCKAGLRIDFAEENWDQVGAHSHVPDWGKAKAVQQRELLLQRARQEPHTAPSVLTQHTLGRVDSETRTNLPKERVLKRAIQRARSGNVPQLPQTFADLNNIPDEYARLDDRRWLQYDSIDDNNDESRILLFASVEGLREMSASPIWFGDGTFKSVPKIAAQLYTVHYRRQGNTFPAVYALMEDRTEQSYRRLFSAIRLLLPENRRHGPTRFSIDFELAVTNAFTEVFPLATAAEHYERGRQ